MAHKVIERYDGEPPPLLPTPPRDPNLKHWSAHLIGGRKMQLLGFVEALTETAAVGTAVALFGIDDLRRRRLVIYRRGRVA